MQGCRVYGKAIVPEEGDICSDRSNSAKRQNGENIAPSSGSGYAQILTVIVHHLIKIVDEVTVVPGTVMAIIS